MIMQNWYVFDSKEEAAENCALAIAGCIGEAVDTRGVCHVALPGGTTPALCLAYLARLDLYWESVHWYVGDERCLPKGDIDRNDRMLDTEFWQSITTPENQCHRIPAELGAEKAALAYARIITPALPLDIAFLGIGEDGHTASLFPGNPALDLDAPVVAVHDAPKPPPDRVSLGLKVLQGARKRFVLATGAGKADAIRHVRKGDPLPANLIGTSDWYLDVEADAEFRSVL